MTIHTAQVRRIRSVEETTFATDQTASMSGFKPMHFTSATISYDLPKVSPGIMQAKMDGSPNRVHLLKRATLTLTCNLTGQPTQRGNGATHTQSEQGKLWRSFLGGQRFGQGDLVAAGSDNNTIEVDAIARWEAGAALAVLGADGQLIARRITDVVGGDCEISPDITAPGDYPADNATAYAAASYYFGPSASDDSGNKTLQFAVEGLSDADRWLLLGGKVTGISTSISSGQVGTATYTIQFVDWKYGADCATDLTADTAPLSYDAETNNGDPLVVSDSELNIEGNVVHASALSIDCSASWVQVPSTSGVNGVIGWARNHNPESVRISITAPLEDMTFFDMRDATDSTGYFNNFHFQLGSDVNFGCVLINAKAQVTNVQPVESDGLQYVKIDAVGGVPISSDTTDIDDSPFVIHMF